VNIQWELPSGEVERDQPALHKELSYTLPHNQRVAAIRTFSPTTDTYNDEDAKQARAGYIGRALQFCKTVISWKPQPGGILSLVTRRKRGISPGYCSMENNGRVVHEKICWVTGVWSKDFKSKSGHLTVCMLGDDRTE